MKIYDLDFMQYNDEKLQKRINPQETSIEIDIYLP